MFMFLRKPRLPDVLIKHPSEFHDIEAFPWQCKKCFAWYRHRKEAAKCCVTLSRVDLF